MYTSLDDEEDGYNNNSISNALYRHVKLRRHKEFQKARKDWEDYNDYNSLDASEQHKSRKRKAHPITYYADDLFVSLPVKQHTDHHHTTCRPRRPPKFISFPNGILFHVFSHNDSKKILDTSCTDLENMLLLQGQYFSRQLWQMFTVFTHDPLEQTLLQESKALEFVKTLHRLYSLLSGVLIQATNIVPPEVLTGNRYKYKQQVDYLCFDADFDNDDEADDDNHDDDDVPTTTSTTAAADLLLTLINQIPPIPSPPPPPSPQSPFNCFLY